MPDRLTPATATATDDALDQLYAERDMLRRNLARAQTDLAARDAALATYTAQLQRDQQRLERVHRLAERWRGRLLASQAHELLGELTAELDTPPGDGHGGYAQPDPPIRCALPDQAPAEDDDPPVQCWHTEPGTPCDWDVCRQPERLATGDRGTDPANRYGPAAPAAPDAADGTVCDAYQPPTTPADTGLCARCGMYDYRHQPAPAPADEERRQRYADAIGEWVDPQHADLKNASGAVVVVADQEQQQLRAQLLALQAVADADSKQLAEVDERCDRYAAQLAALKRAHVALAEQAGRDQRHRDQLAQTLREVLSHFVHKGHPGEPCLQTGWISVKTVDRWRAAARQPEHQPTPPAHKEQP